MPRFGEERVLHVPVDPCDLPDDIHLAWLAHHHVIEADRDARVAAVTGQPFELTWTAGKKQARHVPDLLCGMPEGQTVVTDCRPVGSRPGRYTQSAQPSQSSSRALTGPNSPQPRPTGGTGSSASTC